MERIGKPTSEPFFRLEVGGNTSVDTASSRGLKNSHSRPACGWPCGRAVHRWKVWGEMKSFYSELAGSRSGFAPKSAVDVASDSQSGHIHTRARVAVYETAGSAPRIVDIEPGPIGPYIESLTTHVYELARQAGGSIPYTAIREVSENFIHASFAEPIVSIMDRGMVIRFADQGPGISDKAKAAMPGYTTATGDMKRHIRGVGSGLPIVKDFLAFSGGSLEIEDNLGSGSVVTLSAKAAAPTRANEASPFPIVAREESTLLTEASTSPLQVQEHEEVKLGPRLSTRQQQVLALVMESGSAGPSLVAKELSVGVSTAYRDLASLEEVGLIASDGGKRTLTDQGLLYIDDLIAR